MVTALLRVLFVLRSTHEPASKFLMMRCIVPWGPRGGPKPETLNPKPETLNPKP